MARIVGYIAVSLDGFIAAENGSLDWLFKYDGGDMGSTITAPSSKEYVL